MKPAVEAIDGKRVRLGVQRAGEESEHGEAESRAATRRHERRGQDSLVGMTIRLLLATWVVIGLSSICWAQDAPQDEWTARWIAAPWSTPRDGAEVDGSRPMPVFRRE